MSAWTGARGWWLGSGLLLGLAAATGGRASLNYTSTDAFCNQACHAHPQATQQWVQSEHYANTRGVVVHCVDCHLPPGGVAYLTEKVRLGSRDAYGQIFMDVSKIDWAREGKLDRAVKFTYDAACVHCHSNLFGQGLSKVEGTLPQAAQQTNSRQVDDMRLVARRMEAHLYYQRHRNQLRCINCHLFEGHRQRATIVQVTGAETREFPLVASGFQNYTQAVPGSLIKFHMIAVPAGTVDMGSPQMGACRQRDTGPEHAMNVKPFWMTQATVGVEELGVFYAQKRGTLTGTPSRDEQRGVPSQQVAQSYTDWLSQVTGVKFRLPTEAELEYACMAGGTMPAWRASSSRAELTPADAVLLNAWGFATLPDSSLEFTSDYPSVTLSAWSSASGTSRFRIVREWEPSKQKDSRAQLVRP